MYMKGAYRNDYLSLSGRIRQDFTEKTVYDLKHKVDIYSATIAGGRPDPKKSKHVQIQQILGTTLMVACDIVKITLIKSTRAIQCKINILWSLVFR